MTIKEVRFKHAERRWMVKFSPADKRGPDRVDLWVDTHWIGQWTWRAGALDEPRCAGPLAHRAGPDVRAAAAAALRRRP